MGTDRVRILVLLRGQTLHVDAILRRALGDVLLDAPALARVRGLVPSARLSAGFFRVFAATVVGGAAVVVLLHFVDDATRGLRGGVYDDAVLNRLVDNVEADVRHLTEFRAPAVLHFAELLLVLPVVDTFSSGVGCTLLCIRSVEHNFGRENVRVLRVRKAAIVQLRSVGSGEVGDDTLPENLLRLAVGGTGLVVISHLATRSGHAVLWKLRVVALSSLRDHIRTQAVARGEQCVVRVGAEPIDGPVVLQGKGSSEFAAKFSAGSGGGPSRAGAGRAEKVAVRIGQARGHVLEHVRAMELLKVSHAGLGGLHGGRGGALWRSHTPALVL